MNGTNGHIDFAFSLLSCGEDKHPVNHTFRRFISQIDEQSVVTVREAGFVPVRIELEPWLRSSVSLVRNDGLVDCSVAHSDPP